jgi:oligosaccharide repeat unit polymerase
MKIKKKSVINWYIFISLIILFLLYIYLNTDYKNIDIMVIITFMINGILIFINLSISSKKGYSLNDMFWIFMFYFMFIAPFLQYVNDSFPLWDNYLLTDKLLFQTNMYIFVFIGIYMISYFLFRKKYKEIIKLKIRDIKNIEIILNIGLIISIIVSLYIIINVGLLNLFSRGTSSLGGLSRIQNLIIGKSLRGFPFITLIIHIYFKNKYGYFYNKLHFGIITFLFILTHFPTGLARFQVASVYIALILTYIKYFKNKYFFKIIIFSGLMIVFPLLNIFRNISINIILDKGIVIPNLLEGFLTGNFDSYSMLARSLTYVDFNGITFGKQLMGAMLFFIPRSIWSNKPIGSGAMIADKFNWPFTNVSMPLIGEGYLNFGFFGIIIFSVILGYIINKLDFSYLIETNYSNDISILKIYYPVLIGFLFYILRGDLLSSWGYTVSYFLPVLFFYILDKIINFLKNNY